MSYSPANHAERPYNRCVDCTHIGKRCDGPNFLAMDIHYFCEWSRARKDYLHSQDTKWTNAYVADAANVSKKTVDRLFAGALDDLKLSTAAQIIQVLVDGTWGEYPCAMDSLNEDGSAERCEQLQAALDNAKAAHDAELAKVRAFERSRIDYLKEQVKFKEEQLLAKDKLLGERYGFMRRKDKTIATLAVFLTLAVLIIITALVIDKLNSDIGFFWVDRLSDVFGGVAHDASAALHGANDIII